MSLGLFGAAVLLSACEEQRRQVKKVEEAAAAAAAAAEQVGSWADQVKDGKLLEEGQRLAQEKIDQGKAELLGKMDLVPLKKQADELVSGMRAGDFAAAQKASAALDGALNSQVLQRTVAVLKAKSDQGTDAAQALIDQYVKLPEMGPEERKFFEGLKEKIVTSSVDDRVNFVVIAAAVACEIASKGQGGGKLPEMGMELLFGKEFGILKDQYEWKNPTVK